MQERLTIGKYELIQSDINETTIIFGNRRCIVTNDNLESMFELGIEIGLNKIISEEKNEGKRLGK